MGSPGLFAELSIEVPAVLRDAVVTAADDGRTAVLVGWDGQARAVLAVADSCGRARAPPWRGCARLACARCCSPATTSASRRPWPARSASPRPTCSPASVPMARRRSSGDCGKTGSRPCSSVTGSTTPPPSRRPTSAWRSAPAPTPPSAPPTSPWSAATRRGIADAIELARATMTVIRANLGWAFCYNVIAIPLAGLGYLNPLFAGIAMSASSLIVVANSLRLRRFTPGRPPAARAAAVAPLAPRPAPARGRRRLAGRGRGGAAPGWPAELARAAAGPVDLRGRADRAAGRWAASRGAGTLTRVRLQVTLAAVPMRAFTPQAADAIGTRRPTWSSATWPRPPTS